MQRIKSLGVIRKELRALFYKPSFEVRLAQTGSTSLPPGLTVDRLEAVREFVREVHARFNVFDIIYQYLIETLAFIRYNQQFWEIDNPKAKISGELSHAHIHYYLGYFSFLIGAMRSSVENCLKYCYSTTGEKKKLKHVATWNDIPNVNKTVAQISQKLTNKTIQIFCDHRDTFAHEKIPIFDSNPELLGTPPSIGREEKPPNDKPSLREYIVIAEDALGICKEVRDLLVKVCWAYEPLTPQ